MDNPFYYGRAVDGAAFVNRSEEIGRISSSLERGQSIVLFSPRRYGKTSLIKKTMSRLQRKKVLCFYVDLYTVTSLDEFYKNYAEALAAAFKSPASALVSLLHWLLPMLKPKLVYSQPGIPEVQIEASLTTLRNTKTLKELFESIERYCAKHKRKAAVIFDEFQEIATLEKGGIIERQMRSSFQHHRHVAYAFLGSKMHLMNEMFGTTSRPFYNFGSRFELGAMSDVVWRKDIAAKFKAGGFKIDEQAIKKILHITKGHPYYTQLLCSEIWDTCNTKRAVSEQDIDPVVQGALDLENHAFQELWDSLSRNQRKVVRVLAQETDIALFSSDIARKYYLGAQSSLHRTVEQLLRKGVVAKKDHSYVLTDPFVARWICSRMP
ncbi:MAG: AAA family ATPase [Chitinivibrionales bacterium]|nr:AAA family ATPase [Chitinivibrionales bacterium]